MTHDDDVLTTGLRTDVKVPKRTILAWSSWDWGSSAFNSVIITFVFVTYLTGTVGKGIEGGSDRAATWLAVANAVAGARASARIPRAASDAACSGGRC